MAFLKNPIAKAVGNADPAKIDLVCEVKVQFSDLDRAILQNAQNAEAYFVSFIVRNYDPVPDPGHSSLSEVVGTAKISISMGNPDAHIFVTKTFNRGGYLNEDPYPFPNDEDEIFVEVRLVNLFSMSEMGKISSPVIKGRF